VAISGSGNTVAVGAWEATVGGNSQQGAAYVFVAPGSVWTNMTQTAKLTASNGAAGDYFGCSVATSDDTVVVGAQSAAVGGNSGQGAAYVFTEPGTGWANMTQTMEQASSDGYYGQGFGMSVAMDNGTVVVGAPGGSVGALTGAAYVFSGWSFGLFPPEPALAADTVTAPCNQTITASGGTGPVTMAVSNIEVNGAPSTGIPGLATKDNGNGTLTISGKPTAAGTETFTVTATDSATPTPNTAIATYTITVNPVVTFTPATLPAGTMKAAYNQTITASAGTPTITLAVSNIKGAIAGLNVPTSGTGSLLISGTPTKTGTETFTVTATDSLGVKSSTNYSITINTPNKNLLTAPQVATAAELVSSGSTSAAIAQPLSAPIAPVGSPAAPTGADKLLLPPVGQQLIGVTVTRKLAARRGVALRGLAASNVDRVFATLPAFDLKTDLLAEEVPS
jgi:hypothetical protein